MPSVLITGCDTGLGREFALQYAQAGFTVYATYRDMAHRLESDAIRHFALDVTDFAQFDALKRQLDGAPIDVLVSNARHVHPTFAAHTDATDVEFLVRRVRRASHRLRPHASGNTRQSDRRPCDEVAATNASGAWHDLFLRVTCVVLRTSFVQRHDHRIG